MSVSVTDRGIVIVEADETVPRGPERCPDGGLSEALPRTVAMHARFGHLASKSTATFRPLGGQTPKSQKR